MPSVPRSKPLVWAAYEKLLRTAGSPAAGGVDSAGTGADESTELPRGGGGAGVEGVEGVEGFGGEAEELMGKYQRGTVARRARPRRFFALA
jgi:hypothetical protein